MQQIEKKIQLLQHALTSRHLTQSEKQELNDLLKDPEISKLYNRLHQVDYIEKEMANYERIDYTHAYQSLIDIHRFRYHRIRIWSSISVACSVIIMTAIWLLSQQSHHEPVTIQSNQEIHSGSKTASLTLSSGETIMIDQSNLHKLNNNDSQIRVKEGIIYHNPLLKVTTNDEKKLNELRIPRGGEYQIKLNDGTMVWLNAESTLRYPSVFASDERRVLLEGEAFFDVQKDVSRPFIVTTSRGDIEVLGTTFGVTAYSDTDYYTTLVNGKVACTNFTNSEKIILLPGDQLIISPNGKIEKRRVDVNEYVSWKDGYYLFSNKKLEDILKTFERWYDVIIDYEDDDLKNLTYTGELTRYENINNFLKLLKRLNDIDYSIHDNHIILRKNIKI